MAATATRLWLPQPLRSRWLGTQDYTHAQNKSDNSGGGNLHRAAFLTGKKLRNNFLKIAGRTDERTNGRTDERTNGRRPHKTKKIGDPDPTKRKNQVIRAPQNEKIRLSGPHKTKKLGYPGPTKRKI